MNEWMNERINNMYVMTRVLELCIWLWMHERKMNELVKTYKIKTKKYITANFFEYQRINVFE